MITFQSLARTAAAALGGLAIAQDVSYPAFGNSVGTAFDFRAPTNRRIASVVVNSGTFIDGILLNYENRGGSPTTSSAQAGATTGTAATFVVPDGDYLTRVEVWYDAGVGYISGLRLRTKHGYQQIYGSQTGTSSLFQALNATEVIGLLGTGGALMNSIGVTTRPVLASHVRFGTGCASNLGTVHVGYRIGAENFLLGGTTIVEVDNVPLSFGMIVYSFATIPGGVPLDGAGAPGCTLYVPPDILQIVGVDPGNVAGNTILVPNTTSLVGTVISFQGATFGAPNALDLAISAAMTSMIGVL